jgi:hypothetical protein
MRLCARDAAFAYDENYIGFFPPSRQNVAIPIPQSILNIENSLTIGRIKSGLYRVPVNCFNKNEVRVLKNSGNIVMFLCLLLGEYESRNHYQKQRDLLA